MDTFKETEDYFQFIRPYQEAMDFLMVQIKILNEDYREKYRDYPIHNIQSRIKEKESIVEKKSSEEKSFPRILKNPMSIMWRSR